MPAQKEKKVTNFNFESKDIGGSLNSACQCVKSRKNSTWIHKRYNRHDPKSKLAYVEAVMGEFYRLNMSSEAAPKVRVVVDEPGVPKGCVVKKYVDYRPARDCFPYKNNCINFISSSEENKRMLAGLIVSSFLGAESDLHGGNWGFAQNSSAQWKLVKIDHDQSMYSFFMEEMGIIFDQRYPAPANASELHDEYGLYQNMIYHNVPQSRTDAISYKDLISLPELLDAKPLNWITDEFSEVSALKNDQVFTQWKYFYLLKGVLLGELAIDSIIQDLCSDSEFGKCLGDKLKDRLKKTKQLMMLMPEIKDFLKTKSIETIELLRVAVGQYNQEFKKHSNAHRKLDLRTILKNFNDFQRRISQLAFPDIRVCILQKKEAIERLEREELAFTQWQIWLTDIRGKFGNSVAQNFERNATGYATKNHSNGEAALADVQSSSRSIYDFILKKIKENQTLSNVFYNIACVEHKNWQDASTRKTLFRKKVYESIGCIETLWSPNVSEMELLIGACLKDEQEELEKLKLKIKATERAEKEQKEKEQREKEQKEKEQREKEQREKEQREKEQREKEQREKEQREKEQKEKEQKEKERREKEQREKERREKEQKEKEQKEKERREKEQKEKEQKERREKEQKERREKEQKERREKEQREREQKEKEKEQREKEQKEQEQREREQELKELILLYCTYEEYIRLISDENFVHAAESVSSCNEKLQILIGIRRLQLDERFSNPEQRAGLNKFANAIYSYEFEGDDHWKQGCTKKIEEEIAACFRNRDWEIRLIADIALILSVVGILLKELILLYCTYEEYIRLISDENFVHAAESVSSCNEKLQILIGIRRLQLDERFSNQEQSAGLDKFANAIYSYEFEGGDNWKQGCTKKIEKEIAACFRNRDWEIRLIADIALILSVVGILLIVGRRIYGTGGYGFFSDAKTNRQIALEEKISGFYSVQR